MHKYNIIHKRASFLSNQAGCTYLSERTTTHDINHPPHHNVAFTPSTFLFNYFPFSCGEKTCIKAQQSVLYINVVLGRKFVSYKVHIIRHSCMYAYICLISVLFLRPFASTFHAFAPSLARSTLRSSSRSATFPFRTFSFARRTYFVTFNFPQRGI